MALPDKITKANTVDQLIEVLGDYVSDHEYRNCYSAFHGILRRAHEIGFCQGKESEKELLRIKLGLEPTDYFKEITYRDRGRK